MSVSPKYDRYLSNWIVYLPFQPRGACRPTSSRDFVSDTRPTAVALPWALPLCAPTRAPPPRPRPPG